MFKRIFKLLTILLALSTTLSAQSIFTPQEQQSISVETPGLFDRSTGFTVDFGQMTDRDYSFPLPVGKVDGIRVNSNIIILSKEGDAVKSMFAGTVRLSREIKPWGKVIVIRHDNGLETVYGNNAQNLVKVGDRVRAGQTIAIIGTQNNKTYCEFAVMVNGARINPETILDLNSHRLRRQTLLFQKLPKGVKIKVVTEEKEQTVKKKAGRRQPQRGNMTKDQHSVVQEENSASEKYKKDAEYVAQQQSDANFDIDEYQAIQLEEKVKKTATAAASTSKEFTVNFANYKAGEWCYPMKGGRVISPFGGKRRHAGTDIKTKAGDPIYAAFAGQVVLSGTHYGYGLCIVIRHAAGFETLYSHQSKNQVKVGDWVKAGQQIGIVGRTGRATTEHCHFEIRINGRPIDTSRVFDHQHNTLRKVALTYRGGKSYIKAASATATSSTVSADNDDDDDEEEVATHSKGTKSSKATKRSSKKSKKSAKSSKKSKRRRR